MGGALWAVNPAPASPLGLCRARGTLESRGEPWCAKGSFGVPRAALVCRGALLCPWPPSSPPKHSPPPTSSPLGLSLGAEPPLEWCWLEVSVAVLVPRPLREGSGQRQQHRGKRSGARGSRVPGPRGAVVVLGWELEGVRAAGPAPSPVALTAPHRAQGIWYFQVVFCVQKPPPATRVGAHPGGWALREGRAPPAPCVTALQGRRGALPSLKPYPHQRRCALCLRRRH